MVNPLSSALATVQSHATSLTNAASVLIVIGVELLISNNLFLCPCHNNDYKALENPADPSLNPRPQARVYYAVSYMVWPAVASFIMALAVSGATLRCLTGYKRHCNIGRHCNAFRYLMDNAATAFVPPLAWLVVVFMDGRYFECAISNLPSPCLPDIKTVGNNTANHNTLRLENEHLRSVSQIIGLTCLGGGITVAGLLTLCGTLCSNLTYYQRRYMHMFRQKEMETFNAVSEEMITTELTEKWRKFFTEAQSDDWTTISSLPHGGPTEVKGQEYYTDFHVWQPSVSSESDNKNLANGNKPSETTGAMEMKGLAPSTKPHTLTHTPSSGVYSPLPRHLVGVPINPNSDGALYQGQLATLFVPIQDGGKDGGGTGATNTVESGTQTEKKAKESKKVVFNINGGFEDDDIAKVIRGGTDKQVLTQKMAIRPALPKVEVSGLYQ